MKPIAVLGDENRIAEFRSRITDPKVEVVYINIKDHFPKDLSPFEAIIDLSLDDNPQRLYEYNAFKELLIIGCAVKRSIAEMLYSCEQPTLDMVGLNSLPTFINREIWEMSSLSVSGKSRMETIASTLGVTIEWIQDRVGMVTPRMLFMIINEACFTLQEGTATIEDIDKAMQLGTNYPDGPFAWANKIGISNVYEVLKRLQEDTGEGRYKICPLLKKMHLERKKFVVALNS